MCLRGYFFQQQKNNNEYASLRNNPGYKWSECKQTKQEKGVK